MGYNISSTSPLFQTGDLLNKAKEVEENTRQIYKGDTILHNRYGTGTVSNLYETYAYVDFEHSTKLCYYDELRKLSEASMNDLSDKQQIEYVEKLLYAFMTEGEKEGRGIFSITLDGLQKAMNENSPIKIPENFLFPVLAFAEKEGYITQKGNSYVMTKKASKFVAYREEETENDNNKIQEGKKDYQIHHSSYTDAVEEIRNYVQKNGYSVDDDDMFRIVGSGPRKPSEGKTNEFSIPLYKNEEPAMKKVEVQIYGMGKGYELNMYFGKANKGMY